MSTAGAALLIELAPYFMMYTNLMTYPLKFRQHVLAIKEKLTYGISGIN
ncbi:hypothetical protein RINTU1_10250 [Candidatus Regiella insecticola]|uniref:Uncharacterized protein n=1 Tax=Candidatus Regiella insecticola TaxID=138073 RepID=A0A6L2ZLX7_9ENTR|nr:hypothetical protein RINTU1_10250 [Candidatus Regiella insecticola]